VKAKARGPKPYDRVIFDVKAPRMLRDSSTGPASARDSTCRSCQYSNGLRVRTHITPPPGGAAGIRSSTAVTAVVMACSFKGRLSERPLGVPSTGWPAARDSRHDRTLERSHRRLAAYAATWMPSQPPDDRFETL
jgi:hypothetical protein